jgi:hypothetical protein
MANQKEEERIQTKDDVFEDIFNQNKIMVSITQ